MRVTRPRGRAASPVRTGLFIRQYLSEHGEAYQAEIHRALKETIKSVNEGMGRHIHPPTYESFGKYFRQLVRLGLIELTGREEETEVIPELSSMRKKQVGSRTTYSVVTSMRRYYRLTGKGSEADWEDPLASYRIRV